MTEKIVNKETGEIKKRRVFKGQVFEDPKKAKILTYKEVAEVEKTGETSKDFKIKKKLVVVEEVNRCDYINSFSGDVGLKNILKKLALSGTDPGQAISEGLFHSKQNGQIVDISNVPDNLVDTFKAVEEGVKAYEKLPDDLKKKVNFSKKMIDIKADDISKLIQAEVQKALAKNAPNEEKKVEEK